MSLSSLVLRSAAILLLLPLQTMSHAQAPTQLTVDVTQVKAKASPTLYGLMTEEINHSYDGGIYAELIHNRTFQDNPKNPVYWSLLASGDARATMEIDRSDGPSKALPLSLKVKIDSASPIAPVMIANEGYWGIEVKPSTTYKGSFFAKSDSSSLSVTVRLVSDDTGQILGEAQVGDLSRVWSQVHFSIVSKNDQTSAANHFEVVIARPATLWLSLVSLFPPTFDNRPNGNRIDIMQKLGAMKPSFLRFPGGNYLEGDHINERFEWKKTIGPLVDRSTHPSPWHYHSSDGMGLLEFLEWCEDLKMQPLLAVYAGYSMRQEFVKPGRDLDQYVQDALDEIEYVSGDKTTRWGAERARDGHPAPFPLHYVEIGNEDAFDKSGTYDGRYAQFYKAIKTAYPSLELIATEPLKEGRPDLIDNHFYRTADAFFKDVGHYDKTDRNGPKIFVGEWATREGGPTTNFGAALGDAAWMTGMERNSDVVVMASYAPLFVNVSPGAMQWDSDLIGYDAGGSYGSPSYYAQTMFANNMGDEIIIPQGALPERVFASITRDSATGTLFIKLVNASPQERELRFNLVHVSGTLRATITTLQGHSPFETNSIRNPEQIIRATSKATFTAPKLTHVLPGYAIQILRLSP